MRVQTKHPVTGKIRIVTVNEEEYQALKILEPFVTIIEDEAGVLDEFGIRRHTIEFPVLQKLYKELEDFIADCLPGEYQANKDAFTAVLTLNHQRMNNR